MFSKSSHNRRRKREKSNHSLKDFHRLEEDKNKSSKNQSQSHKVHRTTIVMIISILSSVLIPQIRRMRVPVWCHNQRRKQNPRSSRQVLDSADFSRRRRKTTMRLMRIRKILVLILISRMNGILIQSNQNLCNKGSPQVKEWISFLEWTCKRKETRRTRTTKIQMTNSDLTSKPQNPHNNPVKTKEWTFTLETSKRPNKMRTSLILISLATNSRANHRKKQRINKVTSILGLQSKNHSSSHLILGA